MKRKHMYFGLFQKGRTRGRVTKDEGIPLEGSVEMRDEQVHTFLSDPQGRTVWRKSFHPQVGDNGGSYCYGEYEVNVRVDIRDQVVDISIVEK
jgi:hypothetical protein